MPTLADAPVGPPPTTGAALADRVHPHCVVCSQRNPRGLRLCFRPAADGVGVAADFPCDADFQGYDGLIHGGIVSMLLDGAMAHCLFHHGRVGHTGELVVRFRQGVRVGHPATVSARLVRSKGRMHELSARLEQDGVVKATATARFMEHRWGQVLKYGVFHDLTPDGPPRSGRANDTTMPVPKINGTP